jgi:hypothetical protein
MKEHDEYEDLRGFKAYIYVRMRVVLQCAIQLLISL